MMTKPIGILGGTFDPIHFGHLRCALEILQILDLAEVRLIPCPHPVHKNGVIAPALHRLEMLKLAVERGSGLLIDECEMHKPPTYTVETLTSLRAQFKDTSLCLIVGTDAFMQLPTWHRFEKILNLAHIIVAVRPGYELMMMPQIKRLLDNHTLTDSEDLHNRTHGGIYFQIITQLNISATMIRQQIKAGYDPSYLIPREVWAYIQHFKLYTA